VAVAGTAAEPAPSTPPVSVTVPTAGGGNVAGAPLDALNVSRKLKSFVRAFVNAVRLASDTAGTEFVHDKVSVKVLADVLTLLICAVGITVSTLVFAVSKVNAVVAPLPLLGILAVYTGPDAEKVVLLALGITVGGAAELR